MTSVTFGCGEKIDDCVAGLGEVLKEVHKTHGSGLVLKSVP
jgi:hypothetical protein